MNLVLRFWWRPLHLDMVLWTCFGVACLVAFGEVAVPQKVRVVEDIILYFFAGERGWHLHLDYNYLNYYCIYVQYPYIYRYAQLLTLTYIGRSLLKGSRGGYGEMYVICKSNLIRGWLDSLMAIWIKVGKIRCTAPLYKSWCIFWILGFDNNAVQYEDIRLEVLTFRSDKTTTITP